MSTTAQRPLPDSSGHTHGPARRLSVPVGQPSDVLRPMPEIRKTSVPARRHSIVASGSGGAASTPNAVHRHSSLVAVAETSVAGGGGGRRRASVDCGSSVASPSPATPRSRKQSLVGTPPSPSVLRADEMIDALVRQADEIVIGGKREALPRPSVEFASAMEAMERRPSRSVDAAAGAGGGSGVNGKARDEKQPKSVRMQDSESLTHR